jgi:lysophospholipase L1-like esterase
VPEQTGGDSGGEGAATGGHPSGGIGGSVFAGTGGASMGGAAGTPGTGGAGGTAGYAPCPATGTLCKILPLGDSITRGVKSTDDAGYRSQLFKLTVAANQRVTFMGSLANGPTQVSGQPFPRMHEGHSGWTISQLSPLIPSPALDGKPNIVLLHIGTNDIGSRDPAGMATHLEALIDKIAANSPGALIVVAQITAAFTDNDIRDAYNSKIPGIAQSHAAKGQHIMVVDMNKIPMTDLSSDGVHPNDQGYAYMAGVWYAAIKDLLPR